MVDQATRAQVLVPYLRAGPARDERGVAEARLVESVGLARAIALDVVDAQVVPLTLLKPPTLLGSGKVEEIAGVIKAKSISLVIIDHALSPVQQRNLEKAWNTKVIDRTGLILEIFGERAQTREGRLQVELAHLNYQKSRLVRSWTHLERQRGGFGFLGGPGETQIEADRRLIQERIKRIEHELAGVVQTRRIQRANRKRVPQPVVALVGYTNAGKTTLFNTLTRSANRAEDLLFATLDPTLRRTRLPHGTEIVVSDTVGFISELPTMLVAAFRATLEEVVEADLILHVRDIAHPDSEAQAEDVRAVLGQLGVDASQSDHVIEVWNKIDLLPDLGQGALARNTGQSPVLVSALRSSGISGLLQVIEDALHARRAVFSVHLAGERLGELHRLYELGEVLDRNDCGDGSTDIRIRLGEKSLAAFLDAFPEATADQQSPPIANSA
jgi:GTP-binding protein HflX